MSHPGARHARIQIFKEYLGTVFLKYAGTLSSQCVERTQLCERESVCALCHRNVLKEPTSRVERSNFSCPYFATNVNALCLMFFESALRASRIPDNPYAVPRLFGGCGGTFCIGAKVREYARAVRPLALYVSVPL